MKKKNKVDLHATIKDLAFFSFLCNMDELTFSKLRQLNACMV